jgi:hypothetical protein
MRIKWSWFLTGLLIGFLLGFKHELKEKIEFPRPDNHTYEYIDENNQCYGWTSTVVECD